MNGQESFLLILIAAIVLCCVWAVKQGKEWVVNFVLRAALGAVAIYCTNLFLDSVGVYSGVGINAWSVLTVGILGFPGFLALYGIGIYQQL